MGRERREGDEQVSAETLCGCGHREDEHDGRYDFAPGQAFCTGCLFAQDREADSDSHLREVGCRCSRFSAADADQLAEWESTNR